ncbi:MAG: DUF4440 domain-containing protein [Gemmataceae bacterium]
MTEIERELLALTQKLLESIPRGDWATYAELVDPSLTCYEPEAPGQLVEGMEFHHFYFNLGGARGPHNTTMCSPHVRVMGDVAVVSFARIVQKLGADGVPTSTLSNETRVWHRTGGKWRHVHFHRSFPS